MTKIISDGEDAVRTSTYLAFWSGGPLSNFASVPPFTAYMEEWTNSEAAFMYVKARTFNDTDAMEKILWNKSNPGACKMIGRTVVGYTDKVWAEKRYQVMVNVCMAKFKDNRDLRAYLLGTAGLTLIEASVPDKIWGNGLSTYDPGNGNPALWKGQNLLGKALMDVRASLASAPS